MVWFKQLTNCMAENLFFVLQLLGDLAFFISSWRLGFLLFLALFSTGFLQHQ